VTRLLLRAYPRAWRDRYGDELEQLVDDIGLSPAVAMNLIRGGIRERGRALTTGGFPMMIGAASRYPRGLALLAFVVLVPVLAFVVGSLLVYQLGVEQLRPPMESVNMWLAGVRAVDLALVLSPAVALVLAVVPLVRLEVRPAAGGREALVGVRLRAANLLVGGLAAVTGAVLVWHVLFESLMESGV
jgi:hypothetical protein